MHTRRRLKGGPAKNVEPFSIFLDQTIRRRDSRSELVNFTIRCFFYWCGVPGFFFFFFYFLLRSYYLTIICGCILILFEGLAHYVFIRVE